MTNPQKKEILKAWKSLKEKIKNSWRDGKTIVYQDFVAPHRINIDLAEYQYELGSVLLELGYGSLKPVADWNELAYAIKEFKRGKEKECRVLREELERVRGE